MQDTPQVRPCRLHSPRPGAQGSCMAPSPHLRTVGRPAGLGGEKSKSQSKTKKQKPPTMGMPGILPGTLRAVARDVGSGSFRYLRRYRFSFFFYVAGGHRNLSGRRVGGVGRGR